LPQFIIEAEKNHQSADKGFSECCEKVKSLPILPVLIAFPKSIGYNNDREKALVIGFFEAYS